MKKLEEMYYNNYFFMLVVTHVLCDKLETQYNLKINPDEIINDAQKVVSKMWPNIKTNINDLESAEIQINEIFKTKGKDSSSGGGGGNG